LERIGRTQRKENQKTEGYNVYVFGAIGLSIDLCHNGVGGIKWKWKMTI